VEVGIGLPTTIPDTEGSTLLEWARRADEAGFSTLGTIGRLIFPNYDDLIGLAAAAAVTKRIRLTTSILLAPLHANAALLAKQAASLDRLSGGRFVLGVGMGSRDDDYEASGLPDNRPGRRMDAALEELKRVWSGEERG
jgi:alkanesulfonate monooxygenase SsuD/methylene tetrahydromethanopterin reductase-like flavin-dependent oxidoreductase (luciferase family)